MIVFVCIGNVCRSPLAEALLRSALHRHGLLAEVGSAGTHALVDSPIDPATARIGDHLGVDTSRHRGRQITPEGVAAAQLILTATRGIRRSVVLLHAPAVQYTFTLRQFSRILTAVDSPFVAPDGSMESRIEAVRAFASRHRGLQAPPDAIADDDVVDPRGQSSTVHELAAQQMMPAVDLLSIALGGPPVTWPVED